MSLRRIVQGNKMVTSTPTRPETNLSGSSPSGTRAAPCTPRNRIAVGVYRSPASTASISSSVPFDWNAARSRQPPPYGNSLINGKRSGDTGTPVKRMVRKQGIVERITSIPSNIAFEIALFPHNLPLPSAMTTARMVGGLLHALHLCVRVSQVRRIPDSDIGWEDMYREGEGVSWFDWTIPISLLLLVAACLNGLYLMTRVREYRLHRQVEPVSSPNARFVSAEIEFAQKERRTIARRVGSAMKYGLGYGWRFLLGLPTAGMGGRGEGRREQVQQLEVWTPGAFEKELFTMYSPAHALLWMAAGPSNWMATAAVMIAVSCQVRILQRGYESLVKDREILAAEVMHEYNEGFVYPRLNPIRCDVAVMTHESEVIERGK